MKVIDYTSAAVHSDSFDAHERVSLIQDEASGLQALIAIHNTNLGPAVGGCRMFPYANIDAALEDVLRLSRGMTYKSAVAGLPMGGGKAVILGDPTTQKSELLLKKMGEFIEAHNGKYVTAEDSGICVNDLKLMATQTRYVLGIEDEQEYGGDPSPLTALGIFIGIEAAVKHKLGRNTLQGIKVAIQGAGSVGRYLIKQLIAAGADVIACDINEKNIMLSRALGANTVDVDDIYSQNVDVFCPCAMGGIINDQTISELVAPIVAGGANNQLALPRHAHALKQRGILYAPDFVINAGGIIEICRQLNNESVTLSHAKISQIGKTLMQIFDQSDHCAESTAQLADRLAETRFMSTVKKPNAA